MLAVETAVAVYYELTQEICQIEGCRYGVYGIAVYRPGRRYADREEDCCMLPDLSTDRATAERILHCLAENEVYPIHVREVVSELLG